MHIRKEFAAAFALLVLVSGYLGLWKVDISSYAPYQHTDKGLHFLTFFLLTLTFYWILDTTRRRVTHITLIVVTGVLGCGSEVLQGLIPNDREFDYLDIVSNIVGSLAALGLCTIYHKRMLERKRASKSYQSVPGDEEAGPDEVELDENLGHQETGVTASGQKETNIDEELENWDENAADDWDEEEVSHANGAGSSADVKPAAASTPVDVGKNKRAE